MHGCGVGIGRTHAFELVPRSPGVGVDDLPGLLVVSDDKPHVASALLGDSLFWKDSDLESPEERGSGIDIVPDLFAEAIVGGASGAYLAQGGSVAAGEEVLWTTRQVLIRDGNEPKSERR